MSMASSWYRDWSGVAVRAMWWRRHWRTPRAGYNYYPPAVPGMVAPVGDTAGKVDYHNSEDYC